MADPVKFTIDGHIAIAPGTLLINAAKQAGISIPAFCYYDGLSLQAACRMCLVEVEKTPKLQVACTLPVAEGMVVHTDSAQVRQARKGTLEFLLTNHPLDCPVCDKGGECELQDMVSAMGQGRAAFAKLKSMWMRSNGRRWCFTMRRAAFSVTAVCASAAKAWASMRWELAIAAQRRRLFPIAATIWNATNAAPVSISARSAR